MFFVNSVNIVGSVSIPLMRSTKSKTQRVQRLPKLALAFRNPIMVFELRVLEFLVRYFSYFIGIICWIMFKDVYNDNFGEARTIPNTPVEPSTCILLSVVSFRLQFLYIFLDIYFQHFLSSWIHIILRMNAAAMCTQESRFLSSKTLMGSRMHKH